MINFWQYIKTVTDGQVSPFQLQVVPPNFNNKLRGSVVELDAEYSKSFDLSRDIVLLASPRASTSKLSNDTRRVYWLPWKHAHMTSVSIVELNQYNCDYFMTDELTGCRFVVTDQYIAHVANWAYPPQKGAAEPSDVEKRQNRIRKEKEYRADHRLGNTPSFYRVLSLSNTDDKIPRGIESLNYQLFSYRQENPEGAAQVLGYKDPVSPIGWRFKYLMKDGRHHLNRWHIIV